MSTFEFYGAKREIAPVIGAEGDACAAWLFDPSFWCGSTTQRSHARGLLVWHGQGTQGRCQLIFLRLGKGEDFTFLHIPEVHRLDVGTTGSLLVAKTQRSFQCFSCITFCGCVHLSKNAGKYTNIIQYPITVNHLHGCCLPMICTWDECPTAWHPNMLQSNVAEVGKGTDHASSLGSGLHLFGPWHLALDLEHFALVSLQRV